MEYNEYLTRLNLHIENPKHFSFYMEQEHFIKKYQALNNFSSRIISTSSIKEEKVFVQGFIKDIIRDIYDNN